ncbi:MAG: hypothetical protein KAI64_04690, partial [Thermoplasmata archaeon]|nr:hypothetical protein [Thermoplasmata archaeon]
MPSNLSHCLSAMAVCGCLNVAVGLPSISPSVFFGGFVAMLVNLDYSSRKKLSRTPWGHSVYSAGLWTAIFASLMLVLYFFGPVGGDLAIELSTVFAVSYSIHIIFDFFTTEGIYVFKKGRWTMTNCASFGIEARGEGNALLNIYLCVPSSIAIII